MTTTTQSKRAAKRKNTADAVANPEYLSATPESLARIANDIALDRHPVVAGAIPSPDEVWDLEHALEVARVHYRFQTLHRAHYGDATPLGTLRLNWDDAAAMVRHYGADAALQAVSNAFADRILIEAGIPDLAFVGVYAVEMLGEPIRGSRVPLKMRADFRERTRQNTVRRQALGMES